MNKIEIEIPEGQEIDWQESAKQKKIVFKKKQFTYEDVCEELFKDGHYFIDDLSKIHKNSFVAYDSNAATTKHQLECILAKNKLANVARYLNGDWKWKLGSNDAFIIIDQSSRDDEICLDITTYWRYPDRANTLFKSREAAQQAIEILGEETVKLALEPLY